MKLVVHIAAVASVLLSAASTSPISSPVGTIHVPAFDLPCSTLASPQACRAIAAESGRTQIPIDLNTRAGIALMRQRYDDQIILPMLRKQQARWGNSVSVRGRSIAGVYTEVFTPRAGSAPENRRRVLIDLHGGGWVVGARTHGRLESIPIAAVGKITVISIDYRMAPENHFPAASEDVAAVYAALLKHYKAASIGIYGCSAGGMLTAESVAWFLHKGLPVPGAIAMLGNTGTFPFRGDSAHFPPSPGDLPISTNPYFKGVADDNVLASPMQSPKLLAKFPPSLLTGGTRGPQLSSIVDGANKLTLAGVPTQLNIWDGVGECPLDADLPETHQAETIIVRFFRKYLAK